VRALVGVDERSVSKDDDWRAENEIQWTKLVKLRWGTAGPCLDDSISTCYDYHVLYGQSSTLNGLNPSCLNCLMNGSV
jgi:hypothetical protein